MTDLVEVRTGELVRSVADEIRAESRRIVAAIRADASIDGLRSLADRAEALRLLAKKAGVGLESPNGIEEMLWYPGPQGWRPSGLDSARLFCEAWSAGADGEWTGRDNKGVA